MINKRIVIIGAGAAGVSAAEKLLEHGFRNVVILEAEQRIYGSHASIKFNDDVIDPGYVQWRNGDEDDIGRAPEPACASFSREHRGILLIDSNGECIEYSSVIKLLKSALATDDSNDFNRFDGTLNCLIEKRLQRIVHEENIDSDTEFSNFFKYFQTSVDMKNTRFKMPCGQCPNKQWSPSPGSSISRKGQIAGLLEYANQRDKLVDQIKLAKEVCRIDYTDQGVTSHIEIACTDGSVYHTEHVICTIPLNVVKARHKSIFRPALPPAKILAIETMGCEVAGRINIEFEEPFWTTDWKGFDLVWCKNDLRDLCKQTELHWLGTVHRFCTIDSQSSVLCACVDGLFLAESAPDDELIQGFSVLLRKFLKHSSIPRPIRVHDIAWVSNSHFCATCPYQSLFEQDRKVILKNLISPISNRLGYPMIQFAGEGWHENQPSTVADAIETGWREAENLINFYKSFKTDIEHNSINGMPGITNSSIPVSSGRSEANNHMVDVLILGAGLAGLGFATAIRQKSGGRCSFRILEAQSRAGGRVHTIDLCDNLAAGCILDKNAADQLCVDAGAQWLHGKYNYLYDLAEKNDLLSTVLSEEGKGIYLRAGGIEVDEFLVKKVDFVIGQILEECEEFARDESLETYPRSVEAFLREQFAIYLGTLDSDEERFIAERLLDWHIRFQIIDNSCLHLSDVSARDWGNYSFNGEASQAHYNFHSGFNTVIDNLVEILGPNNILFRKEIVQIQVLKQYEKRPVQMTVATDAAVNSAADYNRRPRISVKCSDGSVYYANHVLVTFSLGVLKDCHRLMFRPRLPLRIEYAICDIGYETINKLYIQFEKRWWGDADGIQLVFDADDENADGGNHRKPWTRWISGFDVMKLTPKNTLLGWVGGPGAVEMEQLSDQQIIADCIQLLTHFTNIIVPPPIRYHFTRWRSNDFVKGAYSYITTDCDVNGTTRQMLNEALYQKDFFTDSACSNNKQEDIFKLGNCDAANIHSNMLEKRDIDKSPIMLFAGEACNSNSWATAHGAFLSGIEQAEKILHYY